MTFAAKPSPSSPGTALLEAMHALSWSDLPADASRLAARCVLDSVACGIFGSQFPWGKIATDFALDEGSNGGATIFGTNRAIAPARAALCNGTMIHGFEVDDMILGSMAHPGTVVIPAALAIAEHRGASADRLLLGIVAGYEMMARLGKALGPKHSDKGYHTTGISGPLAAAVTSSIILGLSFEQMARAIGIACSTSSGIKAFTQGDGGMTKRFHGGKSAEQGIVTSLFAERGFTGPVRAIDGRYGLLDVIGCEDTQPDILSDGLGSDWAIGRVWAKAYTCCATLHAPLQALEAIKKKENLTADSIKAVRIGMSHHGVEQNGAVAPTEMMGAQYSMPFCAAVALTGDMKNMSSFSPEGLRNPATLAMIQRISLYADPEIDAVFPAKLAARVEIESVDGRRSNMTIWDPHGTPTDPCSSAEIEDKFRRLSMNVFDRTSVDRIGQAIQNLSEGGSIEDISTALRSAKKVN